MIRFLSNHFFLNFLLFFICENIEKAKCCYVTALISSSDINLSDDDDGGGKGEGGFLNFSKI